MDFKPYLDGQRSIYTTWILIGLLMLFGGCVAPIKYDASVPLEIPAGYTGKINKQTIRLNLPQLTLYAQIQAYNWDGQYLLKPLGVWIMIDRPEGTYTLDPRLVMLKSDGADTLSAVSFLGPSEPWDSPRALAAGCGPRNFHTGIAITNIGVSQKDVMQANNSYGIFKTSKGAVSGKGQKCFMFWFDTDSKPNHDFLLMIDGLTVNGEKVPVPDIRFREDSLTTFRAIP